MALAVLYVVMLGGIVYWWQKRGRIDTKKEEQHPSIAVIIAARNEEAVIAKSISSVLAQTYDKASTTLVVVNDHSTDATLAVAHQYQDARLMLVDLKGGTGKKAALTAGIEASNSEVLVFTDADCEAPVSWLAALKEAFTRGADMVLAPVQISYQPGFLNALQGLDVAGTMLLTGATCRAGCPLLANGANLAIRRAVFDQLDGYTGNTHRASGDDVFLLQKAVQNRAVTIRYISGREALVQTSAAPTWTDFFRQRLRWAGKTSSYQEWRLIAFQAGVYLLSGGLLVSGLVSVFHPSILLIWLAAWGTKLLGDSIYLSYACQQVGDRRWLWWLLPAQFVHTCYVVVIGTLALLPLKVRWKERRVS